MKPSSASRIRYVNSSFDKKDGFQSSWTSWARDLTVISEINKFYMNFLNINMDYIILILELRKIQKWKKHCLISNGLLKSCILPLWFFRNEMVDFRTVDLSIFLLFVETIELSSLTSMLNWSRLFFSLRFLVLLFKV